MRVKCQICKRRVDADEFEEHVDECSQNTLTDSEKAWGYLDGEVLS